MHLFTTTILALSLQAAQPPAQPPGVPVDAAKDAAGGRPEVPAKRPVVPPAVAPGSMRLDAALEADVELLRRLDKPYPADQRPAWTDVPAKEVVEAIRKELKVAIDIDRRAVGDSGGWEWQRVTCEPATPRAALDAVARAISPSYDAFKVEVAAGIVVFTDDAGRRTLRAPAPYQLGSLLSRAAEIRELLEDEDADADAPPRGMEALLAALAEIAPESWTDAGGDVSRVVSRTGTLVLIETSPAIHKDIRDRLAVFAAMLPPARVLWSVEVLAVPAGAEQSAVDLALSAEALDRATDDTFERLAAPRLLAARGAPAAVVVGSDEDGFSVQIDPVPDTVPETYLVRVRDNRNGAMRELEMRATIGSLAAAFMGSSAKGGALVRVVGHAAPESKPAAKE